MTLEETMMLLLDLAKGEWDRQVESLMAKGLGRVAAAEKATGYSGPLPTNYGKLDCFIIGASRSGARLEIEWQMNGKTVSAAHLNALKSREARLLKELELMVAETA